MVINFVTFIILTTAVDFLHGTKNSSVNLYENVGSFTAVAGRGFSRTYPRHAFVDSGWSLRERLNVYLRTSDNKELFSNTWISLDPTAQRIIGFPMEGNRGEFTFLLCARNHKREVKIRRIKVDVLVDGSLPVHKIVMKLSRGFRNFILNVEYRILFAATLAEYLQANDIKASMRDIWITSIHTHNYTISWTLSTHNKNSCSEILIEKLPHALIIDGKPRSELQKKLNPHFIVSYISMITTNDCPTPSRLGAQTEKKNLIIGPLLIIIIMIGLSSPIFIAYLIRRGIRKREFRRAGDVRHVFSNGAATPIYIDQDKNSENSRSPDDASCRQQYRWSPDMTNRVQVHIPRFPPPRPMLSQGGSQYSSIESTRSSAWHGLPTNQCAEGDGLQLVNIVQSISNSANTIKSLLVGSIERESETDTVPVNGTEDDCFSIKSESSKIFESALKKVSLFINNSYFSAPTLIRVSRSDLDEDSIMTRKSSIETRNSSFECSIMSSDHPTPSQLSSGVNSFDTEVFLTASFSQDESYGDEVTASLADDVIVETEKIDGEDRIKKAQDQHQSPTSQKSITSENENTSERETEKTETTVPLRKTSIRGSLQRLPTIQATEGDATEEKVSNAKSDLLHPWYRDQANVRIQQSKKGTTSQYYIAKAIRPEKGNGRKTLQNEIIYETCYDEGTENPTLV